MSQSRVRAAVFVISMKICFFRVQDEPLVLNLDWEDEGNGEEAGGGQDVVEPRGPDTGDPEQGEEYHGGDVEPDGDEAPDHALRGGVAELHSQLHGEGHTGDHKTGAWNTECDENKTQVFRLRLSNNNQV